MAVYDAQGHRKQEPDTVPTGTIIAFYGARVPEGWFLCDGTNGTPDLTDRVPIGATTAGTGSAAGTSSPTSLTHTGFALGNHDAHVIGQPSGHSAHSVGQPATHTAHSPTQPATHTTHTASGAHTHDNHAQAATGGLPVAGSRLTGEPTTHSSVGDHTHDAHPAHAGWDATGGHTHSGWGVDAHSAHSGFALDAHSAHSVTQPSAHEYKIYRLAYIMKK